MPARTGAHAAEAIRTTAWMPAPLSLLIASRWLEDGTAIAILRAQLAELRARHALVSTLLADTSYNADPRCMFIWLKLPPPWRSEDFAANLRAHGVAVMPATAFASDRQPVEHGVRINLACASSRDELATALRIVATTLAARPRALFGDGSEGPPIRSETASSATTRLTGLPHAIDGAARHRRRRRFWSVCARRSGRRSLRPAMAALIGGHDGIQAYRVGSTSWVFADLKDADGEGDAAALRRHAGRRSRPPAWRR